MPAARDYPARERTVRPTETEIGRKVQPKTAQARAVRRGLRARASPGHRPARGLTAGPTARAVGGAWVLRVGLTD